MIISDTIQPICGTKHWILWYTTLKISLDAFACHEWGGESGEVGGADQILQLIETDTRDSSSNLLTLPPVEMSLY